MKEKDFIPAYAKKHAVANKLEKRSLLIAVNLVAGLSIFFFGYDQGVMGGVNTAQDYAKLMGFGHYDAAEGLVKVDHSLLQGGIVGVPLATRELVADIVSRSQSTICLGRSLVLYGEVGWETNSAVCQLSAS